MIRALIAERADPVLFELSLRLCRRSFGDRRADVAGRSVAEAEPRPPALSEVIETLATLGKAQLPEQLARWLDGLDENGRWALLKLVTGALRIGVSARLAKTAAASLGDKEPNEIEILWPGLAPPYTDLFAWLEGRADKPETRDLAPFRPAMLAHAIEETGLCRARPEGLHRRMEMGRHPRAGGRGRQRRGQDRAALFAHRRGHLEELSRPHRSAAAAGLRSTASC